MANKPKIARFAPSDSSDSKLVSGDRKDRSDLARLYPESKTYEERKRDEKLAQQSYRRQLPKYPHLSIAIYGSVLMGLIVWFVQSLNAWWFGNSDKGLVMSTVFFSFVIWLALVFLVIAWVNYANKLFSYFGSMVRAFWLVYTVLLVVLLAFWLSGWLWQYTNILWIPVLAVIHFIVVFFSAQRIMRRVF